LFDVVVPGVSVSVRPPLVDVVVPGVAVWVGPPLVDVVVPGVAVWVGPPLVDVVVPVVAVWVGPPLVGVLPDGDVESRCVGSAEGLPVEAPLRGGPRERFAWIALVPAGGATLPSA